MPVTDPVADMLARIRNAVMARHETVAVPASKLKLEMIRILKEEGFIEDYEKAKDDGGHDSIRIRLHYRSKEEPGIMGLKRISKPANLGRASGVQSRLAASDPRQSPFSVPIRVVGVGRSPTASSATPRSPYFFFQR